MSEEIDEDDLVDIYELKVVLTIDRETGHPYVYTREDGDADLVTKLGMLELAKDTILTGIYDEEDEDDE